MYWGLYFFNLGLVFYYDTQKIWVRLHTYWRLYFPILGLLITINSYIVIPISFVFHVAH